MNEKYPEEANKSPDQEALSLDYQSAMKRNKQLKQVTEHPSQVSHE